MSFKPTLAEINELRVALQERDAELQRTYECIRSHARITFAAEDKVQEQRKVLEQALEVIKYIGYVPRADGSHPVEKAITAIQEVLK